MKLAPIIRELRAMCPSLSERVFGVSEFTQITESMAPAELPAAFVIPLSEEPEDPATSQRYQQDVTFNFEVVLMVQNTTDEQGLSAWETAVELKHEIFSAILGSDDAGITKRDWIEYRGIRDIERTRAYLLVPIDFACVYRISDSESRHGYDIDRLERFLSMHASIDVGSDKPVKAKIEFH